MAEARPAQLASSTFNNILGAVCNGKKCIPQFKGERTPEPAKRTDEIRLGITVTALDVLVAEKIVKEHEVETVQQLLDQLSKRLVRTEWETTGKLKRPMYFLDEGNGVESPGLQDGKFRRRLRELAMQHLHPVYVTPARPSTQPSPNTADAGDLAELRGDPKKLQEVLDKREKARTAAASVVMGDNMRRLVEICKRAVILLRAGQQETGEVDMLDIQHIMTVFEAVHKDLVEWGIKKTWATVGATGLGKSTALSALIQQHVDFRAYIEAPYPNDFVRMLPALEYMRDNVNGCDRQALIDLVDEKLNLVVDMPLDYAADIAEMEFRRSLCYLKEYGEKCIVPNNMMTLVPNMSARGRGTTQIATRFAYNEYAIMVMGLKTVEEVRDKVASLVGHIEKRFRQKTLKLNVAKAQEVKATWRQRNDEGLPAWTDHVTTFGKVELESQKKAYLAACGDELPWDEDETGRPFISLESHKVPVRLEALLLSRRVITCCGPKAPADKKAAGQQYKPGYQVLMWLADMQVLLNGLGSTEEHKAAYNRIKSCLPPELAGIECSQLTVVLKMPVHVFYPSLVLASVAGVEDLPGSGAQEAHDAVSADALSKRITTAFVVTAKGLGADKALRDSVMNSFVPAMVRAKLQAMMPQAAAGAAAGDAAALHNRAAGMQRQVVLVYMPESLRRIDNHPVTAAHLQQHFQELESRDEEVHISNIASWNSEAKDCVQNVWEVLKKKPEHEESESGDIDKDDDDEDVPNVLSDILQLVRNPPCSHYYPLLGASISDNLDLRRELQQEAVKTNAQQNVKLPGVEQLLTYCNSQYLLQHLVSAPKEQLQERLEHLLKVLDTQPCAALTKLLQKYEKKDAPPVVARAHLSGEQASAFNEPLHAICNELLMLLKRNLDDLEVAKVEELRHAIPDSLALVWTWVDEHKEKLEEPATYLQAEHKGAHPEANLRGVVLNLCNGFEAVFSQVESCMKDIMQGFINTAASQLSVQATAYFQQTIGITDEDKDMMTHLLGPQQASTMAKLLEKALQDKIKPAAQELHKHLQDILDEELEKMLGDLHRSLQELAGAADSSGNKRRRGTDGGPYAGTFLLGEDGVKAVLEKVGERLEDEVKKYLSCTWRTVETVARLPKELPRNKLDLNVPNEHRGQFRALVLKVLHARNNQRSPRTQQARNIKSQQEQLKSITKWLQELQAGVDTMQPGQLDKVVVLTRQPPVRVLDQGLDLDPRAIGATLLDSGRAGLLFKHLCKRGGKNDTLPCTVREPMRGGRNAHHRDLDKALKELGLRRVGVSRQGDRVCNALLVAMTGDKKTPAPQGLRTELRCGAVYAVTALDSKENFEGTVRECLTAGGEYEEVQDWALIMKRDGAGADYLFLQGVVEAMKVRLLIFVTPAVDLPDFRTPGTAVEPSECGVSSLTVCPSLSSAMDSQSLQRKPQILFLEPMDISDDYVLPVYSVALVHSSKEAGGIPTVKLNHIEAVVPLSEEDEPAPRGGCSGNGGSGGDGRGGPDSDGSAEGGGSGDDNGGGGDDDGGGLDSGGGGGATEGLAGPSGSRPNVMDGDKQPPTTPKRTYSAERGSGSFGEWCANPDSDTESTCSARQDLGDDGDDSNADAPRMPKLWLVIDQTFELAKVEDVKDFVEFVKSMQQQRGAAGMPPVRIHVAAAPEYLAFMKEHGGVFKPVSRGDNRGTIAKLLHELCYDVNGQRVAKTSRVDGAFRINLEKAKEEGGTPIQLQLNESLLLARNILLEQMQGAAGGASDKALADHVLVVRNRGLQPDAKDFQRAPSDHVPKGGWIHVTDLRSLMPQLKRGGGSAAGLYDWYTKQLNCAQGRRMVLLTFRYWVKELV